jgi:hypothetical protein
VLKWWEASEKLADPGPNGVAHWERMRRQLVGGDAAGDTLGIMSGGRRICRGDSAG